MRVQDQYVKRKRMNTPECPDFSEVRTLVERLAGRVYAEKIELELCADMSAYGGSADEVFDAYEVSDRDGKIRIRASSGSAFAAGFGAYLRERCVYSIGMLSTNGTLPEIPPRVGDPILRRSKFLYRYFFNYCTFSYTYAFDDWADWERTLDRLLIAGYNMILNPVGIEWVWRETLGSVGYTKKEINRFLCGPAFYAWQWMLNLTGWAGGAPEWWYEERKELAEKIHQRLRAFGVATVVPGYGGMVPDDFGLHFPEARPIAQGKWCGFDRPSILLPTDPHFKRMAEAYYAALGKIDGAKEAHYYSADPFHEGGITDGIDLAEYGRFTYRFMREYDPNAVWVFQGWTGSPKVPVLKSIPDDRVIVWNLSADRNYEGDLYGGVPWIYCAVYCFGGQYYLHGDVFRFLSGPHRCLADENTNIVGIGYMPESVNCNEINFEILAYNAFAERGDFEEFLPYYLKTRYGVEGESLLDAWSALCKDALVEEGYMSESALCARPALSTKNTSLWAKAPDPHRDQSVLIRFVRAMLDQYGVLSRNPAYRRDLMEAARQMVANLSWTVLDGIKKAYADKDLDGVSEYGREFLSLFDIQSAIVGTHRDMLLGTWLEQAKRHGRTPAEKTYFEWNARIQITLWGDRTGAVQLRDYAAREWQGMLEDYYRPRWESFISRLELSLLTDTPLEEIHSYDEELPFVYEKKAYPNEPTGDLYAAVRAALDKVLSAARSGVTAGPGGAKENEPYSFEEAFMKTVAN